MKPHMHGSKVPSASDWSPGWKGRTGLKLMTKGRGLASLHPHFRGNAKEHKNSNFKSGFPGHYKGIYVKVER